MRLIQPSSSSIRPQAGFTLVEAIVVLSILFLGLIAMTSTSVSVHSLRKADGERRIATTALASIVEDVKRVAAEHVGTEPSWSENFLAAYSPAGTPGPHADVDGLEARSGDPAVVSITVVTDETLSDAEVGTTLGLPRDLDHDGLVSNPNVSGTATLLPVLVRVRWTGAAGNRELVQSFFVEGSR